MGQARTGWAGRAAPDERPHHQQETRLSESETDVPREGTGLLTAGRISPLRVVTGTRFCRPNRDFVRHRLPSSPSASCSSSVFTNGLARFVPYLRVRSLIWINYFRHIVSVQPVHKSMNERHEQADILLHEAHCSSHVQHVGAATFCF